MGSEGKLLAEKNFLAAFKFAVAESAFRCFDLADLIVIRVGAPVLLWNGKRRLKRIVCHHAVGVEIAEVEPAACLVPGAHGDDAVAWVGVEPAVGRNVEARPVMTAAEVRLGGQTALPLSGNARAAAQRDEQQREYAAVARVAPCRGFGNVFQMK